MKSRGRARTPQKRVRRGARDKLGNGGLLSLGPGLGALREGGPRPGSEVCPFESGEAFSLLRCEVKWKNGSSACPVVWGGECGGPNVNLMKVLY